MMKLQGRFTAILDEEKAKVVPSPAKEEKESSEEEEDEDDHSKDLLRSLLGGKSSEAVKEELVPDYEIEKVIEVDSNVINFGTFAPGKLLGSTLLVRNISNQEQIVQLQVDAESKVYGGVETMENFQHIKE